MWEAATEAVAVSDSHGLVLAANPAYCVLYGYNLDEVLGRTFALIFPEPERARAEAQYRDVFHGPANQPPFESVVRRRDGTERIVESRIAFVEESGRRVAMVSIVRDITAEVTARHAAEQAEEARQELLSSLSHDIKSPLSVIKGHAQLLRRQVTRSGPPAPPERLAAGLSQIESSAVQVSGLIDQLVEVSGLPEGGAPPLNLALTDLVALARDAVERHQHLADEHRVVLRAAVEFAMGYWDAARVQRVLDNLIGNAIKYSPEGGTVVVSVATAPCPRWPAALEAGESDIGGSERALQSAMAESPANAVLLTVADRGIGISNADLPHVFERFRRGTNVEGTVAGSGIGLSSVREVVRQHGGAVEISSQEGEGTTVSVWLPLGLPPAPEDTCP
jgi:PAS domain S-box-containing protein